MTKRIDQLYLKPQFKIFENALIEWFVIYTVFIARSMFEDFVKEPSVFEYILVYVIGFVFWGIWYVGGRCTIGSYFAVRKVAMSDD